MYQQSLSFVWLQDAWTELLRGAWLTVALTLQAIFFGTAIGILGAWAKTGGPKWLRWFFAVYVEIIRNTPFLLQLFFLFFGLPSIGIFLTPDRAALLAMVVNLGAYATEIIRAGVDAVPEGQFEAGAALGLRPLQAFLLIVLVPALGIIYPPLAGQFTMILLGSSLASAVSAHELTSVANIIASATFRTLEVYLVVTFIYLLIVFVFRGAFALFYNRYLAPAPENRMRML
jgi:polar amino acid transport system permease protein